MWIQGTETSGVLVFGGEEEEHKNLKGSESSWFKTSRDSKSSKSGDDRSGTGFCRPEVHLSRSTRLCLLPVDYAKHQSSTKLLFLKLDIVPARCPPPLQHCHQMPLALTNAHLYLVDGTPQSCPGRYKHHKYPSFTRCAPRPHSFLL